MFVSYTDISAVRPSTSATASWMMEGGQLCPIPLEIWLHMALISSASLHLGLAATYPILSPGRDKDLE